VPAHKAGIVLLANRANFPHEIARYRVLPELVREE
jgi:beta-lactamase class C